MANREGKTEFSALIPTELYEEFRSYFPGYGASTWFINSSLAEFMARVREQPELQQQVKDSIDAMVALNRVTAQST